MGVGTIECPKCGAILCNCSDDPFCPFCECDTSELTEEEKLTEKEKENWINKGVA